MGQSQSVGNETLDVRADECVVVVTKECFDATIRHQDDAVLVADQDPVRREFHDRPREPGTQGFGRVRG